MRNRNGSFVHPLDKANSVRAQILYTKENKEIKLKTKARLKCKILYYIMKIYTCLYACLFITIIVKTS